jgi:hypothetical protein
MTHSMRTALEDLKLARIAVIYPGNRRYPLHKRVEVVPIEAVAVGMKEMFKN